MKKYGVFIFYVLLVLSTCAQTHYYDAEQFPLIGKISNNTETRYERLPACLKKVCRARLWQLGKNTSGLALRFRSNTTQVSVKWNLLENVSLNHMTDAGVKGLDLYAWSGKKWQFVNSARPVALENEQVIISNMLEQDREYLLYLPLYDGITDLQIGIDSTAYIDAPTLPYPKTESPIVCYGTSITQGGCASRPGMSYANILERWLNQEFINLGFSGNGKLDYEIAEVMSKRYDASLFILDFIPNVNAKQIVEKTSHFVELLRKENIETPILFVETIIFPSAYFDKSLCETIKEKNKLLQQEFNKLRLAGDKNLYYLKADSLIGNDYEATVDGIHCTDIGFKRIAEELYKKVNEILE